MPNNGIATIQSISATLTIVSKIPDTMIKGVALIVGILAIVLRMTDAKRYRGRATRAGWQGWEGFAETPGIEFQDQRELSDPRTCDGCRLFCRHAIRYRLDEVVMWDCLVHHQDRPTSEHRSDCGFTFAERIFAWQGVW